MGGSLDLVRWLVDTQLCPVAVSHNAKGQSMSIQTSCGRTVLDLAMSGHKPKTDILHYLVASKGLSVTDIKDTTLAPQTLEAILKGGLYVTASMNESFSLAPLATTEPTIVLDDHISDDALHDDSVVLQDPCALCCERETNCVLVPCGHQICCTECGHQVASCPVCKVQCTVLRIFRQ
jgi:Zinc finger, C3HC4 type (RING finger)